MTPPTQSEPLPYDYSLVADLHGTIALEMTLRFEDLTLHEAEGRFGNLSLFGDPGVRIRFPTPVSPLQAGVALTYFSWQLPRMGPLIVSTAVEGATSYAAGQGWEIGHSASLGISHVRAQWLEFNISAQLNVTADPSWRNFEVAPGMGFGLTFRGLPELGQIFRRR